ncbi:MAG: WxcM-like, C-terminal [Rhodocyclales bacterium]|nr:WxcM-like, C-terminal [Rhodocyclales bacterium]
MARNACKIVERPKPRGIRIDPNFPEGECNFAFGSKPSHLRSHANNAIGPGNSMHISPMTRRHLDNFSSNSVCLVLASEYYDEADYFREKGDFMAAVHAQTK